MLESVSAKNMCNEHEGSTQREVPACRSQNRQHAQKGLVTMAVLTFAAVLFKHRNEGEAICTYQAMLGNNKGHSKLTSQHTNPQNTHSYTNSSSFFHSLHWNVPLASTHNKKNLKCALKVCSESNGLKRCTLGMQKCMK